MRIPIILSYRRDYDLISLYDKLGKKQFLLLIKDALRAIIKQNNNPKVSLTNITFFDTDYSKYTEDIRVILSVTAENDKNLELLLSHIGRRLKNQFIKQAVRLYVGTSTLTAYLDDEFKNQILKNIVPTQVLFIGNFNEPKQRKPRQTNRIKRTNNPIAVSHSTSISQFESISQPTIVQPAYKETFIDTKCENANIPQEPIAQSEADEMLAMLSAMLD